LALIDEELEKLGKIRFESARLQTRLHKRIELNRGIFVVIEELSKLLDAFSELFGFEQLFANYVRGGGVKGGLTARASD
jgi:hypothetical protein